MKPILIAVAVLILASCSTIKTHSDYDLKFDFNSVNSYAWSQERVKASTNHGDGLLDQRVKKAVHRELLKKGLIKGENDQADILLNYFITVDKRINPDSFNTSFGFSSFYSSGWGSSISIQTPAQEHNVATLILDIVDRSSGKLIWRGSVENILRNNRTPEERAEVINRAVNKMLLTFPPTPQLE